MKKCSKCEKESKDDANFCFSCGAELPRRTKEQIDQEIDSVSRCKRCGEPYPEWARKMYRMVYDAVIEDK